jgi:hypothetical protein
MDASPAFAGGNHQQKTMSKSQQKRPCFGSKPWMQALAF